MIQEIFALLIPFEAGGYKNLTHNGFSDWRLANVEVTIYVCRSGLATCQSGAFRTQEMPAGHLYACGRLPHPLRTHP